MPPSTHPRSAGLLGDTAERDYSRKLQLFNQFAGRELRQAIESLALKKAARVLDAGCGTGEALRWFFDIVGPEGVVKGADLSAVHVAIARASAPPRVEVLQGDLLQLAMPDASFDLVWCVNTINHFHEPLAALRTLKRLLRPAGRIALGQSSLLPDMYFAWDARLERVVNEAVRLYYRERYGLEEKDLAAIRGLVGLMRAAGLRAISARTLPIERVSPLEKADRDFLLEAIFRGTWGERLRPHLSSEDYEALSQLCDPASERFALNRPDFHFIQTFTLVVGTL